MADQPSDDTSMGRGTRRKKFAGYLKAANEMRQSYTQAYLGSNTKGPELGENELDIPGAFPNLKVSRNGDEEMVLFPSYARRHNKKSKPPQDYPIPSDMRDINGAGDAEYWRKEWEYYEDKNAVVDVDVRGWIYAPQRGPMNRKNRLLLGIARHLSGIPAPSSTSQGTTRQENKLAEKQAQAISQKGESEADVAGRGGYSENPGGFTDSPGSSRSASPKPGQFPHLITNTSLNEGNSNSIPLSKRASWTPADMSEDELAAANAHLLRRLMPFFTSPTVGMSLTVFYYNEHTSQSRTTRTNESGHFNFRAALDFVPTHVRVLASERLSATAEIIITEPRGVSLVSDIDDTIKHSAIGSGAKEIFRNAFVRDLSELTIEGVRSWYKRMADMGVKLHYVSNSPWQMYPLLVTYFAQAQLPPGSFHLKQYSGMLQGIFEPVAERKKATLDRIMNDFPERRFILVGDSGEADLELYTETALRDPKRVIAIFIRDVTTSRNQSFFDSSFQSNAAAKRLSAHSPKSRTSSGSSQQPALPSRVRSEFPPMQAEEPEEELIFFSDDEPLSKHSVKQATKPAKRQPPPRPSKPLALRSNSGDRGNARPPPPPPRQKENEPNSGTQDHRRSLPVATAYHDLPAMTLYDDTEERMSNRLREAGLNKGPPLPPRRGLSAYPVAAAQYASSRLWSDGSNNRSSSPGPVNKREELWKRRLARAKEILDRNGVILRTWRVGSDVEQEAVKLIEKYG